LVNLYEEFKESCKEICKEFSINPKNIKFEERLETPHVGVDYEARMKNHSLEITFHVRTDSESDDPTDGKISGSLTVKDSDTSFPRTFKQSLGSSNLSYWVKHLVYDYNIENNPVYFKKLFRGRDIKVYGFPGYSELTNSEFIIFMTGLTKLSIIHEEKVTAYRFRHRTDDNHFFYSYAIYVPDRSWVFFPFAAGGGGGGGQMDFEFFEKIFNKRRKYGTERRYFDAEYKKLEEFLLENELKFSHSVAEPDIPFPMVDQKISRVCKESFLNGEYSDSIFKATIVLEKEIKRKSGIKDKIGVSLVETVFNKNKPILEIVQGSEREYEDEREGFKFILKGAFLGIKNPGSHSFPEIENTLLASEYISFIDLLLQRIRDSKKVS